jgi:cation:H+ antiporter
MLTSVVSLLIGFALLVWSADVFTDNGAKIARIFNISPLIIGLLVFGFGTSAPEMLVSGLAAYDGHPELSIGNAFGSNIFNIGLVLAVAAIIHPVIVEKNLLKKEWLFLFLSTLLVGFLLMDGFLSFIDGFILLILMVLFLYYVFNESKKDNNLENEASDDISEDQSKVKTWLLLIISLVILVSSARLIVWGGTNLALAFGVSDLIIGLTVVALGTSLPELAVVITSTLKKQHLMIMGNIIGSNLFNSLGVLAIPGLILPFQIPSEVMSRDYIYMLTFTLLILAFSLKLRINRLAGVILLTILASYLYQLVWI